jgi:hypothetical protein
MGAPRPLRNLARHGHLHYSAVMIAVFALLAAVQVTPPARGLRVEELPNGQFRIIVANRGMSTSQLTNGMIRSEMETRAEAGRRCQGLGGPVPIDRGSINVMADNRWETIQTFACRTPPAPAATPPTGN